MRRFFSSLPPGVRQAAGLLVIVYIAALVLRAASVDLYSVLGLKSQDLWRGQVWKLASYVLLPTNLLGFAFNLMAFLMLAPRLEQCWNRIELWSFCLICAACAGLAKALLTFHGTDMLLGMAPVLFGLLAAWVKLFGREEMNLMGLGTMTVGRMVVAMTAASVILSLASGARWIDLFISLCGGLGAWAYLVVRWRKNLEASGRQAISGRINRLEL